MKKALAEEYLAIRSKVIDSLDSLGTAADWIAGVSVARLEHALSSWTNTPHVVTCGNGTDALKIALSAIDITAGDEVITTAYSFPSAPEAILALNAIPIFTDIDYDTFNATPDVIKNAITAKTKAIIATSLFGQPSQMDDINKIADEHGITVIEDAAQSFGGSHNRKWSCNLSEIAITSFFPTKPLGCFGDGGAIFTTSQKIADRCRLIRNHGRREHSKEHILSGTNSRLDSFQAEVLLLKLGNFWHSLKSREIVAATYASILDKSIGIPAVEENCTSSWAWYTIKLGSHRNKAIDMLKKRNLPVYINYPTPLNMQPAFTSRRNDCPIAQKCAEETISLPVHPRIKQETIINIAKTINDALSPSKRI